MSKLNSKAYGKLRITAFFFIFLFLVLSVWQLQRGLQKQDLELLKDSSPLSQQVHRHLPDPSTELRFGLVELEGRLVDERTVLLDNSTRQGRVGYEVLSPLELDYEPRWVWVNRGWIQAPPLRSQLPNIPQSSESRLTITGHFYPLDDQRIVLSNVKEMNSDWPKRLQQVSVEVIEELTGHASYPYLVRSSNAGDGFFANQWTIGGMTSGKHYGYAVQWFLLAITVAILIFRIRVTEANRDE